MDIGEVQDRAFSLLVLLSVLVFWIVVFAKSIKIAQKRSKVLKRMEAINNELSLLNDESLNGETTPERDAEITERFRILNKEFDNLNAEFEGRK